MLARKSDDFDKRRSFSLETVVTIQYMSKRMICDM